MSELDDVKERLNDRITELESELTRLKSPMEGAKTTAAVREGLRAGATEGSLISASPKTVLRLLDDLDHATAQANEWSRVIIDVLQRNPGFDWRDFDDGVTASEAAEFFVEDMNEAWRSVERANAQARSAADDALQHQERGT